MGYAGQASFGQNAFAAIGGYTSAVLTTAYNFAPIPALAIGVAGAIVCAVLIGYPTLRLKGHYLAMATLGDRADRVRDHRAMAVDHQRLHGHLRHPTARHRQLRGGERPRAARPALGPGGALHGQRVADPSLAFRPRPGGALRQRRCGAGAGDRCRALQARRIRRLGGIRGACGITVRTYRRVREPGSVWHEHGDPRLHHALCRRDRHHHRPAGRGCGCQSAARDRTRPQGLSGPCLWGPAHPSSHLCAGRARRAWLAAAQRRRAVHLRSSSRRRRSHEPIAGGEGHTPLRRPARHRRRELRGSGRARHRHYRAERRRQDDAVQCHLRLSSPNPGARFLQ